MKIERQRYIRFKIFSEKKISVEVKDLATLIWRQYNALFGEIKSGKAGFWIIDYNDSNKEGTIRCAHAVLPELVASLTLMTTINNVDVSIDTIKSSGILAKVTSLTP